VFSRKVHTLFKNAKRDRHLLLMILPTVIFYFIFHYIPMYGIVIAFKDFNISKGLFSSPWSDPLFKYFHQMIHSFYFVRLLKNTLIISLEQLLLGFPLPIIFALLLNEIRNKSFKYIAQTASYLPHFISMVVVVGLMMDLLSPTGGLVNNILGYFDVKPIAFFNEPSMFRSLYVGSGIWQEFGWNSIIFLAAIAAINPEMYETAIVDGASRFQQLIYVTLPSLVPTIIILLIINMGWMFSIGYEKIILMYNTATYSTGDVFSTYVYRKGLLDAQYSFAGAVGLANSIINIVMLLSVNYLAKRSSNTSLF
jgi:putative aldouronate transport system permease protein